MNFLPLGTQPIQVIHQPARDALDLTPRESVILPQLHRTCRTVQIEYRLTASPDYMHVNWPMIVWINHNA
jgi:hypothetical protein